MDRILLIGTFVCIGILALFFILNIIRAVRGKEASKVFTIGLHLSGIAAAVFNAVRVFRIYDDSRGVMLAANIIVIISLVISLMRSVRGTPEMDEGSDKENAAK